MRHRKVPLSPVSIIHGRRAVGWSPQAGTGYIPGQGLGMHKFILNQNDVIAKCKGDARACQRDGGWERKSSDATMFNFFLTFFFSQSNYFWVNITLLFKPWLMTSACWRLARLDAVQECWTPRMLGRACHFQKKKEKKKKLNRKM